MLVQELVIPALLFRVTNSYYLCIEGTYTSATPQVSQLVSQLRAYEEVLQAERATKEAAEKLLVEFQERVVDLEVRLRASEEQGGQSKQQREEAEREASTRIVELEAAVASARAERDKSVRDLARLKEHLLDIVSGGCAVW